MWHEALEEASRLYFGEHNIEGMLAVLDPLHTMLEEGPETGTSSFLGEFPISVGAFQRNSLVATLAALGMILGAAYSLWLYNRVVSGNFKPDFLHKFSDPNGREVSIFLPFLVGGATVR